MSFIVENNIFLCEFHRPNYKVATFNEIIFALLFSFNKLQAKTFYYQNDFISSGINIALGTHRLYQSFSEVKPFPDNTIIFNLEPLHIQSENIIDNRYLEMLSVSKVIDYSPKNIATLKSMGNDETFLFKFGFFPFLNNITVPKFNHSLFYGVITERREIILNTLVNSNFPIKVLDDIWAFERDYEIISANSVVNISKTENSPLEIYRLWHALSLGTSIISEKGFDPDLALMWSEYVSFSDNLDNINGSAFTNQLISPKIYKNNTSFEHNCVDLLKWISLIF